MELGEINPLQNIVSLANLPSICAAGICSLGEIQRRGFSYESIAEDSVQERRESKDAHGLPVHEYACLYFDARNPMLFLRLPRVDEIGIVCVDTAVLRLPGVRISKQNMARASTRHYPLPEGLALLHWDLIYAESWHHQDARVAAQQKGIKCAEALVPGHVPPEFIREVKVGSEAALHAALSLDLPVKVTLDHWLFFDQGRRRP